VSSALDQCFDHAATIGARIEVKQMAVTAGAAPCWRVRLVDVDSGSPEAYGPSVGAAALLLMRTIDGQIAHLEHLRQLEETE
jgi:hypothetical protein